MAQDFNTKFDIGLPSVPNTVDRELYKELSIVYNSIRLLSDALERRNRRRVVFLESATLFRLMSFVDDGGVTKVRLAQHGVHEAHCISMAATNAGETGEVSMQEFRGSSANPPGTKFWLSATPGQYSTVSPGAGGQRVGVQVSSTELWLNPMLLP